MTADLFERYRRSRHAVVNVTDDTRQQARSPRRRLRHGVRTRWSSLGGCRDVADVVANDAASGEHVDDGVLDKCGEDEDEAGRHPDIDGFDVGDPRQRRVDAGRRLGGSRQNGQQADGDSRRRRVDVDPERDPRQDDDEQARHVELDQEVADVSAQNETDFHTRKGACAGTRVLEVC